MKIVNEVIGVIEKASGIAKLRADIDKTVNYVRKLGRRVQALEDTMTALRAAIEGCVKCGGPDATEPGGMCTRCASLPSMAQPEKTSGEATKGV